MEKHLSDEARVAKMLEDGKITSDEAARLAESIAAQQARDRRFVEQLARRSAPQRRRLILLFVFCGVFFVIGLGAGSVWFQPRDAIVGESSMISEQSDAAVPRVIDLKELTAERRKTMGRTTSLSLSVAILAILALIGIGTLLIYNGLVGSREKVNAGWAQVENVYQRRLDLVPVLVDGVKTYMEHERETLIELTEARAHALGATGALGGKAPETVEQLKAIEASQGQVKSALARLFAVVENYPDLKASQNFLTLQDQIEGTENRVTIERRNFNELSRRYNTRILTFPSNLVADMLGFESKPYFQAEASALEGLKDPFGRNK
ncbi:MAG: LemA family protein [Gammaproteobacteria bacterium]|nr:LemA family protein [Gammaproteobacteria bacterium]